MEESTVSASRYHDISCGHRVSGHESKCRHLHGHNYRVHFTLGASALDTVGRVLDFSVIKSKLCMWLEDNWDHKFLAWTQDPVLSRMVQLLETWDPPFSLEAEQGESGVDCLATVQSSIVWVPFNPTAENMALHLLNVVGPSQLEGTGCVLVGVTVEETAKCSASAQLF